MFLHGGAWRFGLADSYTRHVEYAVSRGAVGVSVEYRLATEGRTVHHCIGDCAAAVRYLRENAAALGILPDKICVCGESAGDHLALCLGRRRLWPIRWPDPITSSTSTARSP